METRNISINKLHPNTGQIPDVPENPRLITEEKFSKLKRSIEEDPEMLQLRPLGVYELKPDYFVILLGNMRFRAMQELGYSEAPCKVIPADTPAKKLRAYTIKDNVSFGDNNWECIANEWDGQELADWGVDLPPEWEDGSNIDMSDHPAAKDDDFDEDSETIVCRCKKGDVWQCGSHRVMCGDSTQSADVQMLMGGVMADLWLTDPPYNVDYTGRTKEQLKIQNDKMNDSGFREFLVAAFGAACDALKEGGAFYIWHADSAGYNFRGACNDVDLKVRECLIWNKNSLVLGRQDYQWKHEPCLYGWKDGAGHNWYSDRSQATVLDFQRPTRNAEHPTMKPIPLFAYLISNSTKEGDWVLDSFGGSGTTLIACEQLKRKCCTMELDEHYCDVILARWEKLTGKEAIRIREGVVL